MGVLEPVAIDDDDDDDDDVERGCWTDVETEGE
jgi:hypothetical protein